VMGRPRSVEAALFSSYLTAKFKRAELSLSENFDAVQSAKSKTLGENLCRA